MKKFLIGLAFLLAIPFAAAAQPLNPTPGAPQACNGDLACLRMLVRPSTTWTYVAASGGITDTTAVTIKAAAGAGKRNYIRSCQYSNSGAAGTEVLLVDGAAGTVLHRHWVAQTSDRNAIRFDPPLRGSVNTLLEVDMSSGTTIAVRVNCQGYTD